MRTQLRCQVLKRTGAQRQAILHCFAPNLQRVGDVLEPRSARVFLCNRRKQSLDLLPQRLRCACREQDECRGSLVGRRNVRLACIRFEVFLQDDVCIGASRAEGRDSRDTRIVRRRPGRRLALHEKGRAVEVDVRTQGLSVQAGHEFAMFELQQYLRQARDARGALAMPDVRLDRSDRTELSFVGLRGKCLRETGDLDRVAKLGSCAVRLDVTDRPGRNPCPAQRLFDQLALCIWAGDGVAAGPASMIDARTAHHPEDTISIATGGAQRLEQDDSNTLSRHEAIGSSAEAAAAAVFRQHPLGAQADVAAGMQIEIDPSGERQLAFLPVQVLAGFVNGRQRSRAHRVDRHAGTMQVEHERNPVGDGTE